jgi:2-alkenal reductase
VEENRSPFVDMLSRLTRLLIATVLIIALVMMAFRAGGVSPSSSQNNRSEDSQISSPAAGVDRAISFAPTITPISPTLVAEAEALQQVLVNVYRRVDPSVVYVAVTSHSAAGGTEASGSGFVYDTDGHIITNGHVVQDAQDILVTFNDGYTTSATVAGLDDFSDLAVIKVNTDRRRLMPVTLGDSANLQVGQSVIAIGNPFGLLSSMTTGVISATGRALNSARMLHSDTSEMSFQNPSIIQIDAQINPGNSGGPLLNLEGEVIGINTAIRSETGTFQGIGFAVPVNTIKRIVPQLIANGKAVYTWLGITAISPQSSDAVGLTVAALAEQYHLPVDYGVLISEVMPNSPAAAAGLQGGTESVTIRGVKVTLGGDIITAINGNPVRDFDAMTAYLVANTSPGDVITLTLYRGSKQLQVDVRLEARPTS